MKFSIQAAALKIASILIFAMTILAPVESVQADDKKRPVVYAYNYWAYKQVSEYMQLIEQNPEATEMTKGGGDLQCLPLFKNALKKGKLDVRYALGYFDDSQGVDIIYDGFNFGMSPSLDVEIFHVLRRFMTEDCDKNSLRVLCGFKESGDANNGKVVLYKNITLMGAPTNIEITLTHASASESFVLNQGELAERQKFLTLQSEDNYFNQIGVADIVFYNGHSRDGGGPDFNPPILDSKTLHTNYSGYYHIQKPGFKRLMKQLKAGSNKDFIYAFFSCYSKRHFYKTITAANPKQRLIMSTDTVNYFDSLNGSIGYLEGLLRGQCNTKLKTFASQNPGVTAGFEIFNMK